MKKLILAIFIILVILLIFGTILINYSFPGQVCGKPPIWFRECFPGYLCKYPYPPSGIDTDFGICIKQNDVR